MIERIFHERFANLCLCRLLIKQIQQIQQLSLQELVLFGVNC